LEHSATEKSRGYTLIDFHITAILVGVASGVVGGLLPGFGNLLTMVVLLPFISAWTALDVIICYAVMTQLSQFVGSITSLYTGVPGEPSSMPTVIESKRLTSAEDFSYAASSTALGSAFAAFVTIAACVLALPYLQNVAWFYRTEFILVLMIVATVFVCSTGTQPKRTNLMLLVLGLLLGSVGWNSTLNTSVLTFGVIELYQGIPTEVVVICLFALPQLLQFVSQSTATAHRLILKFPEMKFGNLTLYSVLGMIGGLVPGLTTVLSSQIAYAVACKRTDDAKERILASETANNAGAISQLIPLLVLGLPLVASEALTLNLMETTGFMATPLTAATMFMGIVPGLLFATLAGIIFAWPLATRILMFLKMNNQNFRTAILGFLILITLWQAHVDMQLLFVLSCILVLLPFGLVLRKFDTTSLIFGFLISDRMWELSYRMVDLYS
jgi:putative tricarboxylic transport membrane protein